MEADAGIQLINHSNILKKVGVQPRIIIGDQNSSMISAVRADNNDLSYHKLADKNHLVKNFARELYKLQDVHKQLKRKRSYHTLKNASPMLFTKIKVKVKHLQEL